MIQTAINLFFSGLLFGAGPCMASCGPLLISYIAGTEKNIGKGMITYLIFSFSRIAAYLLLVMLIFFLGQFVVERFAGEYSKYISMAGGVFIIFVGMVMVLGRHLDFGLLKKVERFTLERDIKSIILFGLIIGFLPCVPLIAIFSFIGLISKGWLISLLFAFSFGLGTVVSPLILLVILTGLIPKFIGHKTVIYQRLFSIVCGLVIIFLGMQLIYAGI